MSLRCWEVPDEGEGRSVGRPVGNVNRPLPAKELDERLDMAAIRIHQPKPDLHVAGMTGHVGVVGEEKHLASIRRWMRKPRRPADPTPRIRQLCLGPGGRAVQ